MRSLTWAGMIAVGAALAAPMPLSATPNRSGAAPAAAAEVQHDYRILAVSMPHHLSKPEARRRIKNAIAGLQRDYGFFLTVEQQIWSGYHLRFRALVLGQAAVGTVDVTKDHVNLRVLLPRSLSPLATMAQPVLLKSGTAMLAKK